MPLEALGFKSLVYVLGLVQCYLVAGIHALHSFGQQRLISGIACLRAVLQVGRSEESLLVRHPINAVLNLSDAHDATLIRRRALASDLLGLAGALLCGRITA